MSFRLTKKKSYDFFTKKNITFHFNQKIYAFLPSQPSSSLSFSPPLSLTLCPRAQLGNFQGGANALIIGRTWAEREGVWLSSPG